MEAAALQLRADGKSIAARAPARPSSMLFAGGAK